MSRSKINKAKATMRMAGFIEASVFMVAFTLVLLRLLVERSMQPRIRPN
jgi:hypothetical protein